MPRRRVAALVLLQLMLLGGLATGSSLYRCRFDHIARKTCCCPRHPAAAAPTRAAISRASCCDVTSAHIQTAPTPVPAVTEPGSRSAGLPPILIATPVVAPTVAAVHLCAVHRLARPPDPDLPVLLLKHSFLI